MLNLILSSRQNEDFFQCSVLSGLTVKQLVTTFSNKLTMMFVPSSDIFSLIGSLLLQERHDVGELLLSLNYLPTAGRLNVDIIKAKQLLQTDLVGGSGE